MFNRSWASDLHFSRQPLFNTTKLSETWFPLFLVDSEYGFINTDLCNDQVMFTDMLCRTCRFCHTSNIDRRTAISASFTVGRNISTAMRWIATTFGENICGAQMMLTFSLVTMAFDSSETSQQGLKSLLKCQQPSCLQYCIQVYNISHTFIL